MDVKTIKDAAKELEISPAALYQAINRSEVKTVLVLGRIGLTPKEIERFKGIRAGRARRGPLPNGNGNKKAAKR